MRLLTALLLIGMVCSRLPAQSPLGKISGTITDKDTQQPLPGVNLMIEGTTIGAATDLQGYYQITSIPVGSYSLRANMIGYKSQVRGNVQVVANRPNIVNLALDPTILEGSNVIVTAGYFEKVKDAATSVRSVDYEEIRSDPVGSHDILSMMQSLPSVVSGADQTNEIIVRGGAPGENLFVMDHLEIPYPVHYPQQGAGGGPVTMVNTDFIERIDFFAGSFPARYGEKLSSVMDVTVREGNFESHESKVSFDMSGFGATLEGPITQTSSYLASVKRSFLDFVIQQSGLMAVPTYWTFQSKLSYHINSREKLYLNYLGGIDDIEIVGEDSPQNRGADNVEYASQQHTIGLTYKNLLSKNGYLLTSLAYNYVIIDVDIFSVTEKDPHETTYKGVTVEEEIIAKADFVHKFNNNLELSLGFKGKVAPNALNIQAYSSRIIQYGYAPDSLTQAIPISETEWLNNYYGDTTIVVVPLDTIASTAGEDTLFNEIYNSLGFHAQIKYRPASRVELTLGGRFEYNAFIAKANFSPRISLNYQLLHNLKLNLAGGRYYQAPFNAMLIFGGEEAKSLNYYYADQISAGIDFLLREDTRVTLEYFKKEFSDMPSLEIVPDRNEADSLGDFKNLGAGRSSGVEFFIQKKFSNNWYGTLSYSHSIAEGIDPRKKEKVYYPWDYDYRNVISLIGGYKIKYMEYDWYQKYKTTFLASATSWLPIAPSDEFEVSFRLRYAGGKPYTPRSYDHNTRLWHIYASDDWNTERMDDYLRFDIMVLQRHYFEKMNLVAFWDIMNVFNRDNPWDYVYNEDGTKDIALQFKTFPIGGITLEF